MFGKSDEEKKKEEEKKKLEEEQHKLEEKAVEGKKPDEGAGLGGLKGMGSGPDEEKKGEKPARHEGDESKPEDEPKEPEAAAETKDEEQQKTEEPKPVEPEKPAEDEAGEALPEETKPKEEKLPEEPPKGPEKPPAAPEEKTEVAEAVPDKKETSPSEIEKLKKQLATQKESMLDLEKERADALKKGEELAGLVEDLSTEMKGAAAAPAAGAPPAQAQMPDIEPRLKEIEEKTASQIKALQETLEGLNKQKEEEKKDEEEVAVTMKKMFDKRLKELSEKLDETKAKPAAPGGGPEGAKGEAAAGMMAMGGGVELKKEIDGLKKSMKDLATLVDAFKEEAENRFMALDRELEVLNTFPDMEQKIAQFEKKLGTENVQRLRTLISSADDLKEEVIPVVVKRETEEKLDPFAKRIKKVEDDHDKIMEKFTEISNDLRDDKKDIKALYKFDERLAKLEDGAKEFRKLASEFKAEMKDLDKNQRKDMVEKMKEVFPGMLEAEASTIRKDFAGRFAFVEDKIQSVENMVNEIQNDVSELSAIKGEMDAAEDTVTSLKEEDERLENRIDALKAKDQDLLDMIEKMQTPKEIITELDNKTKDIVDIREFFVRRTNQLDEKIKEIDERAIPTRKLHEKVDSIFNNLADLRENQKNLEQKFDSEKRELQKIIAQHAAEKRQLEDKLKEQKARIGYLLKEFK